MAENSASFDEPFNLERLHGYIEPLDDDGITRLIDDSGSLAEFWRACDRVDWMLAVLNGGVDDKTVHADVSLALRKFARWCALEANVRGDDALMIYATSLAEGRRPPADITLRRNAHETWLAVAGVQGLPRCIPVASAALTAWHAGADDPASAAWWASHYAIETIVFAEAELRAPHWEWPEDKGEEWRAGWHTAAWLRAHPSEGNRLRDAGRTLLARGLRYVIPAPF